jgi:hypothetical protein
MECRWLAKALADAGRHLTEIRQQRLYKHGGHATFAAYLREVGIGRADARRFMALHEVAEQKRAEAAAGGAPAGEDAAGQG